MVTINPVAFDVFAADYDSTFTHSTLGRLLRPRVWEVLARHFRPGDHVLELACGTGEDAVWLAQRGLNVTATDGSARMVAQTQAKAQAAGVAEQVNAVQMLLQQLLRRQKPGVRGQGAGSSGAAEQGNSRGAGDRRRSRVTTLPLSHSPLLQPLDFAQGKPSTLHPSNPSTSLRASPPPLQPFDFAQGKPSTPPTLRLRSGQALHPSNPLTSLRASPPPLQPSNLPSLSPASTPTSVV